MCCSEVLQLQYLGALRSLSLPQLCPPIKPRRSDASYIRLYALYRPDVARPIVDGRACATRAGNLMHYTPYLGCTHILNEDYKHHLS